MPIFFSLFYVIIYSNLSDWRKFMSKQCKKKIVLAFGSYNTWKAEKKILADRLLFQEALLNSDFSEYEIIEDMASYQGKKNNNSMSSVVEKEVFNREKYRKLRKQDIEIEIKNIETLIYENKMKLELIKSMLKCLDKKDQMFIKLLFIDKKEYDKKDRKIQTNKSRIINSLYNIFSDDITLTVIIE